MAGEVTRREVVKITAGAMVAAQVAAVAPVLGATAPHKFFTPTEYALVDELTEILIPTDDHSPGARAAAVAHYLDVSLAEEFEESARTKWRAGLKLVDATAQAVGGKPFMQLTPEQRVHVLEKMAGTEKEPTSDEEKFFAELKSRTLHAYYTSDIGIHKEMEYKGNTMLQEYVGTDVTHPVRSTR